MEETELNEGVWQEGLEEADSSEGFEETEAAVISDDTVLPEGSVSSEEGLGADDQDEEDSGDHRYNNQTPELSEEELDVVADTSLDVIRGVLRYFNAEDAQIDEYEGDEGELIFDVVGADLAVLIGRHGKTLEALQFVVSAIVNKRMGYRYPVQVDIEGYVNRHKQKLISLAKSSAARAIRQKRTIKLRPMTPYERRIIHVALKNDRRIKTISEGDEPNRQIVIQIV